MSKKIISTIAIFDSGIGGLSVLRELTKLPIKQFIYIADTAHLPYGEKSPEQICSFTINALRLLKDEPVDGIVIACHTVSAIAFKKVKKEFPSLPIWSVVDPAIEHALSITKNNRIGVMATPATIKSAVHKNEILKHKNNATVFPVACQKLVPLIESSMPRPKLLHGVLNAYIQPLIQKNIDTLILGCTHYELIHSFIASILPNNIAMVSVPPLIKQRLIKRWLIKNKLKPQIINPTLINHQKIKYRITGNIDQFIKNCSLVSGHAISLDHLQKIQPSL